MLKQKNSKKQGDVGLGFAIAYFVSQGYTVSVPLTDSQAYDLLIDDGQIKRVQVKTTVTDEVELRTLGGNQSFHTVKKFDVTKVDYVFVLTESAKYLIPVSRIKARSRMTISQYLDEFRVEVA